jgi:hypothetical protein
MSKLIPNLQKSRSFLTQPEVFFTDDTSFLNVDIIDAIKVPGTGNKNSIKPFSYTKKLIEKGSKEILQEYK